MKSFHVSKDSFRFLSFLKGNSQVRIDSGRGRKNDEGKHEPFVAVPVLSAVQRAYNLYSVLLSILQGAGNYPHLNLIRFMVAIFYLPTKIF